VDVAYVSAGILTVNEVRQNMGLGPLNIEGGEVSPPATPSKEVVVKNSSTTTAPQSGSVKKNFRKFNPYHDPHNGQFTTAEGAGQSEDDYHDPHNGQFTTAEGAGESDDDVNSDTIPQADQSEETSSTQNQQVQVAQEFPYFEENELIEEPSIMEEDPPLVKPPLQEFPQDPTLPPGPGWVWRGRPGSQPGDPEGGWYNPDTQETLHPDLNHEEPIGPHWDYIAPTGQKYRWFPDGTIEPTILPKIIA
jgi:hypothetical protein